MAELLVAEGAKLHGYDPCVSATPGTTPVQLANDPYAAASDAAAVVLLTEWPQFRRLDWPRLARGMAGNGIVDTRNYLRGVLHGTGLAWYGLGRSDARC